jgi:calcineurin-like phosphoesterase family protein
MAHPSQEEQLPKILAYTPLLSQLASVCCMILGKHDVACDLQRHFIQGIVNFFKRLFYMAHILWTGQYLTIHPNQAHCCTHDLSAWMAALQNRRLWDLCLPGTHNSHAYACRQRPLEQAIGCCVRGFP